MNDEQLREKLEELHLELLEMAPAEKSLQEQRDALAERIRETLDHKDLGGFHVSLKDTLNNEILIFEAEHPRVAQIANGIRDLLTAIGI